METVARSCSRKFYFTAPKDFWKWQLTFSKLSLVRKTQELNSHSKPETEMSMSLQLMDCLWKYWSWLQGQEECRQEDPWRPKENPHRGNLIGTAWFLPHQDLLPTTWSSIGLFPSEYLYGNTLSLLDYRLRHTDNSIVV